MSNKPWEVFSESDYNKYQRNKFMTETKGDPDGKLHAENEAMRKKYNITSDDYGYNELQMQKAYGGNSYDGAAAKSLSAASKYKRYSNPYEKDLYNVYDKIKNFSYDPESDPSYAAYKNMYERQGKAAQDQVYSNLTAMSGGRNNSWASAAVAQTANASNQKIADKIPELARDAYNKLLDEYNVLGSMSDRGLKENQAAFDNAMKEYTANADMAERYRSSAQKELDHYYDQLEYEMDAEKARLDNIRTQQEIDKANIELKYLDEQELIDLMKGKMDIESARALIQQRKAQTAKIYSQMY